MLGKRIVLWVGLVLALGCSSEEAPTKRSSADRGPGLADGVFGSCASAADCDGASEFGNCWCDDACAQWGDCCFDKAEVCAGPVPADPPPVLCLEGSDCPDGMTCDATECASECRDSDCSSACLGVCAEPELVALPHPVPEGPSSEPDGEPSTSSAEDVACDCPDGELCVPLCPVCPEGVPEEDCPCTTVCVGL